MQWSVVTGRYGSRLHISLRAHDSMAGAGRLLKKLLRPQPVRLMDALDGRAIRAPRRKIVRLGWVKRRCEN